MEHITLPEFRTLGCLLAKPCAPATSSSSQAPSAPGPGRSPWSTGGLAGRPAKPWRISGKSSGRAGLGFSDTVRWTIMLADMRR